MAHMAELSIGAAASPIPAQASKVVASLDARTAYAEPAPSDDFASTSPVTSQTTDSAESGSVPDDQDALYSSNNLKNSESISHASDYIMQEPHSGSLYESIADSSTDYDADSRQYQDEPYHSDIDEDKDHEESPMKEFYYQNGEEIELDQAWLYAHRSVICSGHAVYYRAGDNRNKITVCVNAGHGTSNVGGKKTFCHPDGTPKVTGGTTASGATKAIAISTGMDFLDGTPESEVTLEAAKILKEKLLAAGFDVLMIRESDDVQLDNVARTVIANNCSHCHIALHWDSTENDKGAFFMSVPDVQSYRNMEPVAQNWEKHEKLGESLIYGLDDIGVKIFGNGSIDMDLTQTSYSTVPSVDIELGDAASDHSNETLARLCDGLVIGVSKYFLAELQ